jgi:hypothetical protein
MTLDPKQKVRGAPVIHHLLQQSRAGVVIDEAYLTKLLDDAFKEAERASRPVQSIARTA